MSERLESDGGQLKPSLSRGEDGRFRLTRKFHASFPLHRIRWQEDIFGNSVAMVEFQEPAADLSVHSTLQVEQFNTNPFDFVLECLSYPFADEARYHHRTSVALERRPPDVKGKRPRHIAEIRARAKAARLAVPRSAKQGLLRNELLCSQCQD